MEETLWVQRSKEGDMDAFEHLVSANEKKVYTIAYRYMGNAEDAGDVTQEAFLKAWKSIQLFREDASFGTWVCRIAANCALDLLRKQKHLQWESLDDAVELEEGSVQKNMATEAPGPEEILLRKEAVVLVQQCINQLKPEQRVMIVMREMMNYSYEEIAEKTDCSVGTVKSRLSRAREHLKNIIIKEMKGMEGNRDE